jgi:4-diphosphocytidyl-2-C-methyl-D-erythritol kinase
MQDFPNAHCRNDLENVAKTLFPEINAAISLLSKFGNARMTGSGSCVFIELGSEAQAQQVLAALPKNVTGFVARGLDSHPLCEL